MKSCEDCDSWCVLAMDCRWRKNLLECSFKIMQCVPYLKKYNLCNKKLRGQVFMNQAEKDSHLNYYNTFLDSIFFGF